VRKLFPLLFLVGCATPYEELEMAALSCKTDTPECHEIMSEYEERRERYEARQAAREMERAYSRMCGNRFPVFRDGTFLGCADSVRDLF
jgi:hypothetical protein